MTQQNPLPPPAAQLPGVKNVIAIASGKGGVGKSTVSVNLAASLAAKELHVGLMDADIYGPNVPMMMGVEEPPAVVDNKILPVRKHGIKMISMGFFLKQDEPVVWRGPMVHGAIRQFLTDVDWGELDYLLIDLPPGTGDVQLTLAQTIPLTGAVIVTTPQNVSLADASKALKMFEKVRVPTLGLIENMSYFVCPNCAERYDIFSSQGGCNLAEQLGVSLLGQIPLYIGVRQGGDDGVPVVLNEPDSEPSTIFNKAAETLIRVCAGRTSAESSPKAPVIFQSSDPEEPPA